MNKAKPFMFWIVCGVIILLELISLFFVTNSPSGSDGRDPVEINSDLDKRFKDLTKQYQLAVWPDGRLKTPLDVFDPTDLDPTHPNSFKHLLDEYLPTKQWKVVLDDYVAKDKASAAAIAQWLATRSQPLHTPIFADADLLEWYQAHYLQQSHDLLQQLNDAKAVVLPDQHETAAPTGAPPTGDTPVDTDPLNNATARAVAGFFTRGNDLPSTLNAAGGTATLTLHLHIMEQLVATLIKTGAINNVNPLLPNKVQRPDKARLVSIEWQASVAAPTVAANATASPATAFVRYPLRMTVEGPTSAVLALEASLEGNPDETKPLIIVTGGSLARKAAYVAGERTGVPAENITAHLDLMVLDFSGVAVPAGAAPAAGGPVPGNAPGVAVPQAGPGQMPGQGPAQMPGGQMPPGGQGGMPPGGPPGGQMPGGPGMPTPRPGGQP